MRINGLILKREGEIIVTDGHVAIIKRQERCIRQRYFIYLVKIQGKKYTHVYRLKKFKYDYWFDIITKENKWRGNEKW